MEPTRLGSGPLRGHNCSPTELSEMERRTWRAWCEDAPTLSPFYSPFYSEAVAKVHPGARVCVIRSRDAILGFFPFQFASPLARWLRAGEPIGGGMTDYVGLVATPALHLSPRRLLKISGLANFTFTHLDMSQSRFGLSGERREVGLLVDLAEGGAATWRAICERDHKLAADTRRRERQLEESYGPLRFCFRLVDPADSLSQLIEVKRRQYARTGVPDALADPWKQALLHRLAEIAEPDFAGVLSTLHAGDTWVALHFGLRSRHVLHYWFPVYNPLMARFSPGRLLVKRLVEVADDEGFAVIDRGAGDTPAKRDFANASHDYLCGRWVRPDLRAAFWGLGMAAKWRLDRLRESRSVATES